MSCGTGRCKWRARLAISIERLEPAADAAMACAHGCGRILGFVQTALCPACCRRSSASLKAKAFIPDLLAGASSQLFDLGEADNDFLERWIDYLAFALSACPPTARSAPPWPTRWATCTARTLSSITRWRFRRGLRGPRGLHQ